MVPCLELPDQEAADLQAWIDQEAVLSESIQRMDMLFDMEDERDRIHHTA